MRAFKKSLLGIFTFVFATALFITSNINVNAAVIEEYSNTQAANVVNLISDGDYSIDELVDTLQEGGTFLESLYYMDAIAREDMYIEIRSAGVYELETFSRYYFIQEMIKLNNSTIITVEDVEQLQSLLDIHLELVQFYSWFDLDDDEVAEIEERVANSLCAEAGLNGVAGLSNYEAYLKSQSSLDIDKLLTQLKVFPNVFGEDFVVLEEAFRNIINDTFKISSADSESEVIDSEEYVGNIGGTETTRPYERDTSKVTLKLTDMMNGDSTFDEIVTYWLNSKYPLESLHLVDLDTKAKYFNKITAQELEEFKMHVKYEILREMIWYDELSEKESLRELDTNTLGAYYEIYMDMVRATDESVTKEQLEKAESNVLDRELTLLDYDTAKTIPSIDKLEVYLDSTTDLLASEIFSKIEELNVVNSTATLYDIQNFKDYIYDIYGFSHLKEEAQEKIKELENTPSILSTHTVTGYTKQVHTWGLKSGVFTIDYSYSANCCRYNRASTPAWTSMNCWETGDQFFRKLAYYGHGGPGDQWTGVVRARGHNDVDARIETAIAMSDYNIGLSATYVKDKYEQFYHHVNNNYNALPNPPSNFHVIYCQSPNTSYQDLIFWYQDPVYTVTYNSNHSSATYNGSTTWSENVIYNTSYTTWGNFFSVPTGRYFAGWNESRNGGGTDWTSWIGRGWTYSRNYNTTLYAQWGYEQYDITYNLDGGTNHSSNPSKYTYATGVSSFYNPTKHGYDFQGWYTNSSFASNTKVTSISASQTGNVTLYAKWTPTPYTITYDLGGGTVPSGVTYTTSYNIEQSVGVPVNPVHPQDFIFLGWFTDSAHTVKFTGISKGTTGNKTIYASWLDPKDIAGTYIDGVNGSDSNSGLAPNAPVKTFKRAYTIAQSTGGTIYVVNQVTISSAITLDKTYYKDGSSTINIADGYEVKIMRYSKPTNGGDGFGVASYTGIMLNVRSYGTLTIEDIEINGHRQAITEGNKNNIAPGVTTNCGAVIQVWGLVDDDTTDDSTSWEEFEYGTVIMNKGSVINNTGMAFHIGEIQASGAVTINGGYIGGHYNNSQGDCEDLGVIVNHSELTINGGDIDNNYCEYNAGAIYNQYHFTGDWAVFTPAELTITGGTFTNNNGFDAGVVYNMGGTLTISGGIFDNNNTRVSGHDNWDNYVNCGGGAISNHNTMIITGGTFSNNSSQHGGAIYTTGGDSISNATFENNNANYWGGAVMATNSGVTFNNCIFADNHSTYDGGALYLDCNGYGTASTSSITGCTFTDNTGYNGGAIYAVGTTLTVINSNFNNNCSNSDPEDSSLFGSGGALYVGRDTMYDEYYNEYTYTTSSLTTDNCIFNNNSTTGYGGATYIDSYTPCESISDEFNSNFAYWGGGAIDCNYVSGTFTVSGGTFTSNISGETGGAISNESAGFTLISSEFKNNTASYYDGWTDCGGAILSTRTFLMMGNNNIEYSSTNNDIALWNSTTKIQISGYPDFTQTYLGRITPDSYTVGRVIAEFNNAEYMGSDILYKPSISLTPYNNYVLRGGDNIYGALSNTVVISEKYNITYNDSGASGTVGMPDTGLKYWNEDYIISDNIPTSASGVFLGWDTSMIDTSAGATPTYTQDNNRLAYNINADTILYAAWDYVDGAYVDGVNGSDSNDGKSPDKAVKTFRQAYENIKNEGGTIFIVDTVTIDKNMTLTKTSYTDELGTINLADGKTTSILRYARPTAWESLSGFTHESNDNILVNVIDNITLNIENILIDGHLNPVESVNSKWESEGNINASHMIYIQNATVNILDSFMQSNYTLFVTVEGNSVVTVDGCEISDGYEGFISADSSDDNLNPIITISDSELHSNTGIHNIKGTLELNNCKMYNMGCGIIYNTDKMIINNSEIYGITDEVSLDDYDIQNLDNGIIELNHTNIHDLMSNVHCILNDEYSNIIMNSTTMYSCFSSDARIYNFGTYTTNSSIFENNTGTPELINNSGNMQILESKFNSNDAFSSGIINNDGELELISSLFKGNTGYTGAIYNTGTLELSSSTFEDNQVTNEEDTDSVIYNTGTLNMTNKSYFNENYDRVLYNQGNATLNIDITSKYYLSPIINNGDMNITYIETYMEMDPYIIENYNNLTIENFNLTKGYCLLMDNYYSATINNGTLRGDTMYYANHIIINSGDLVINDGEFSNIENSSCGALINNNMGYTEINGGTFNNISVDGDDGVIYNWEAELIINGGTFTNNSTDHGGVIYNHEGNVTITDGTFTNNTGWGTGDVLYNNPDSTVTITGGTFTEHNNATVLYNSGTLNISGGNFDNNDIGVVYNSNKLNITGGEFTNNGNNAIDDFLTVAIYNESGNAIVQNATFSNNGTEGETEGAAIHNQSQMFIDNCTFDGNTSANGGAIYNTAKEEKTSGLYDADTGELIYTWNECIDEEIIEVNGNTLCYIGDSAAGSLHYMLEGNTLVIDDTINTIDGYAFHCSAIERVYIPDSVTSIGEYAFDSCTYLESVRLPEELTEIHNSAFSGCNALKNIVIPDSVISIGDNAFESCTSLETINIPDSVTTIGNSTFSGCSSLESINIPDSVTTLSHDVFSGCQSLISVTLPNSITTIGYETFINCTNLKSVTLSSNLTEISAYTFINCTSLESVTIPDSVNTISTQAFDGCSNLKSIVIPDSVTTVNFPDSTFNGCNKLDTIYFKGTQSQWDSLGFSSSDIKNAFVVCSDTPAGYYDSNNSLIYTWSEMLDDMHDYASVTNGELDYCTYNFTMTEEPVTVVLPNTITSIGDYAFSAPPDTLKNIIIPNSVTSIGKEAFAYTNIESLYIPDSVTTIGNAAFANCANLRNIIIPSSVTYIDSFAFNGCSSLTSAYIDTNTKVAETAFDGSSATIYYNGTKQQWLDSNEYDVSVSTANIVCMAEKTEPLTLKDFGIDTSSIAGGLTIQNSTFTNNSATSNGGAVYNEGDMEIIGSTFDGNSADNGGAIHDIRSDANTKSNISSSEFMYNKAIQSAGAVMAQLQPVTLKDCNLHDNSANNGGAVTVHGVMYIENCIINNNSVETTGGAINNTRGYISITDSAINNNIAVGNGGGIYSSSRLVMNNTELSNNEAALGSGVYIGYFPSMSYTHISGSTVIDPKSNDVYISNTNSYITVTGELTEDKVARITPNEYTLGRTVVKVDNLSQDIPYSVASEIYEKFELEPFDMFALRPGDYVRDEEGITDTDVIISEAYDVTYNLNTQEAKVENAPVNQTKYWSEDLQLSTEYPKAPGFNFLGWDENINLDTSLYEPAYQPGDYYTENRNINLYGNWTLNMTAAYIDGINGNDEWSGATPSNPVKTFEQAYKNLQSKGGTIYVVGNVPINEDTTLDMSYYSDEDDTVTMNDGTMVIIKRYSKPIDWDTLDNASDYNVESYLGYLITVNDGATLTTENITIDGHCTELISEEPTLAADGLVANESLILVNTGGRLNVIWSTLMNSYLNTSADSYGGAVFNNGYTYIDFPSIQNNMAKFGGAFYNSGSGILEIAYIESVGNEAIQGGVTYNIGTLIINGGLNVTNEALEGGVLVNYGTVDITESSMSMNHAVNFGGAIVNGGTINANLLALTENRSDDYAGALLNNTSGTFNMTEGSFESNTAETYGGVMLNLGNMTLVNSHVFNNTTGTWGNLNNSVFGTLTLNNVEAYNNIANEHGGVLFNTGTLVINGGNYHDNSAVEQGGVLYNGVYSDGWKGTATITGDAVLSNNSAGGGGAIMNYYKLTFESGLITKNNATTTGGGISNNGLLGIIDGSITYNTSECGAGIWNGENGTVNLGIGASGELPAPEITVTYTPIDNWTHESSDGVVEDHDTESGTCSKCGETVFGPGLYDENDNLISPWNELVITYGLDIQTNHTKHNDEGTLYNILVSNISLRTNGKKLVISDSVTHLGSYALSKCCRESDGTSVSVIMMPDSITSIDSNSFYYCEELNGIQLPNKLDAIGDYAFEGCINLKNIEIPDSVINLGKGAFKNCESLTKAIVGDNVKNIGMATFANCYKLSNISIGDKVESLGMNAFGSTKLVHIKIPDNVSTIDSKAFNNCTDLKYVYIPKNTTTIPSTSYKYAIFTGCSSSLKIYCESESAQPGWGNYWNYYSESGILEVIYNTTKEQYDNIIANQLEGGN